MSKPTLYTFPMSVWAAVPELALIELGYTDSDVEKKIVNLVEGENFKPTFLRINPNATLPTLQADGKTYITTTAVTNYLVQHAKVQVKLGSSLIDKIHEDSYDPNFPLLLARSDEELKAKASGFPMKFLSNRQDALNTHSVDMDSANHRAFYDRKLAVNSQVLAIYQSKVPDDIKNGFFKKSEAHWKALRSFILDILPSHLPENGFIGGGRPGEDDFHAAAWLARIAAAGGAKETQQGLIELEKEVGKPIPVKVANYWNSWAERESWKMVYGNGLH